MIRTTSHLLIRCLFALCVPIHPIECHGQAIQGSFDPQVQARTVVLYGTRGTDHPAIDSTDIGSDGRFSFAHRSHPPGFYQLGIQGTDRVDIILDPSEPVVELVFHGTPLQRNMEVIRSGENQRMWAFKFLSRTSSEAIARINGERASASPLDTAVLRSLERQEAAIRNRLDRTLDSLTALAPQGQFAFAVDVDRRLEESFTLGPAGILSTFEFSDQRLLRSASYAKAMMAYLQATPFIHEFALHRACDTLLHAASRDSLCWTYTRHHLIEIFITYGPDDLAQYLVDRYVIGDAVLYPPDESLLAMAADQLRMGIGAPAPDMVLVSPGSTDTLRLAQVLPEHDHTGLFFYSSTCDHCHQQMPGLRQLVQEMEPARFQLIGIALDATEEEFRATIEEEVINWPCYTELKGWGAQGAKDFNVKATPSFYVLDRNGRIVAKPMDHEALRTYLISN